MTLSNQILPNTTSQCYHCGELCNTEKIVFQNHVFCCNGCKTVFEILDNSELDNYYENEFSPGIKPTEQAGDYEFLELPEVQKQIIQFEDENIIKVLLKIPQIHCSSCIYLLENLHQINPSIVTSRVNFQRKEITLTLNQEEKAIYKAFQLLNKLGYTPQLPTSDDKKELSTSKSLLIKIGIAGFCFGNIMLLSFPEYVAGSSVVNEKFSTVFNYLILLFAIPVLAYSAKDYYTAAYQNLKHKNLSVDIPIVLGISALFVRSIYEMFVLGHAGYFDSLAGFVFFLLIGKWFQSRTYENLSFDKSYSSFYPLVVLKKSKDGFETTRIRDLKVGDSIKLRNNEILPVNAQLLDETAVFDYSFVTGESKTIVKHRKDALFAGGKLSSGSALFMVTEEVNQEYLQDLWKTSPTENQENKLTNLIDYVSQRFTITIILIAIIGLGYWGITSGFNKALTVFTSILIVACPCALALAAPFTYGNATRLLNKINIFLKEASVIEQLNKISVLVFDKTGTLTKKDSSTIQFKGDKLDAATTSAIKLVVSCSIHPLSKSLTEYLTFEPNLHLNLEDYSEAPGLGIKAMVNSDLFFIGSKEWLMQNNVEIVDIETARSSTVFVAKNHQFLGYYEFSNSYRTGILEKIDALKNDFKIAILSGDNDEEEVYLNQMFHQKVELVFNQSPIQKQHFIQNKQRDYASGVMMLGDGINDAIALKQSNIGVAIAEDTSSFTPNSDIIMHADSLASFPEVLKFGKDCKHVLYACLFISILYNIIGLGFAFSGLLSPLVAAILMPLSSITVVAIAVGFTNYYAYKRFLLK